MKSSARKVTIGELRRLSSETLVAMRADIEQVLFERRTSIQEDLVRIDQHLATLHGVSDARAKGTLH
jgi:hypothetical protein